MHIIQCHILLFSRVWLNTNIWMSIKSAGCKKTSWKWKSLKVSKWTKDDWRIMKDKWRMMKVELWRMVDDDFKLLRGFDDE